MFQVTITTAQGALVVRTAFESASVLIGRVEGCDIRLDDDSVSRKHMRIWDDGQTCFFEDLNFVAGGKGSEGVKRVDESVQLAVGAYRVTIVSPQRFERDHPYHLRLLGPPVSEDVYPLESGQNLIGREGACEVTVPSEEVSRKHASITISDGTVQVADLESANGVYVNGTKHERVELKHGDVLLLGDSELLFSMTKTQLDHLYPDGNVPKELRWSQGGAQLASQRPRLNAKNPGRIMLIGLSSLALVVAVLAAVLSLSNTSEPLGDGSQVDGGDGHVNPLRMNNESLAEYMNKRTVWIMAKVKSGWSTGTGFFIAPNLVLTNRHVVEGTGSASIMSRVIAKETKLGFAMATVKYVSKGRWPCTGYCRDYAVLELKDYTSDSFATFTPNVAQLDEVVAVGFPGAVVNYHVPSKGQATPPPVATQGVVNAILNPENAGGPVIINHDARVMHGNSGGPLVDRCGRVIGINTFVGGPGFKADFALGTIDIVRFLEENNVKASITEARCRGK